MNNENEIINYNGIIEKKISGYTRPKYYPEFKQNGIKLKKIVIYIGAKTNP